MRSILLRWLGWFGLVNGALAGLIGLRYVLAFGAPESGLAGLYMMTAYLGHFATLGFLPLMLLLGPLALLLPARRLIISCAVLLVALMLTLIVLDTNIFVQYRYHISRLTVEIFDMSTWIFAGGLFVVLLIFQSLLAVNVWQRVIAARGSAGIWLGAGLAIVWLTGQGVHIWADATAFSPVTSFNRYLPAYYPIKAKRRLAQLGWVDPAVVERQRLLRKAGSGLQSASSQLNYPLAPLSCSATATSPDIVVILIDALRPDTVNAQNTPRIAQFAGESQNFSLHYSGGNSSRMGIFSLFYGLPSTYWQSFYELQQPPVVMTVMAERGYQFAGFSSVGFGSPAQIDRTVFAGVNPEMLWTPTADAIDKNEAITREWINWFSGRRVSDPPAFSFLYFDPGFSAADAAQPVASESEVEAKRAAYLSGIAGVDREVAEILAAQDAALQGRETVTIIFSDHGYEFDDLGLGYLGHASNYGRYQLRTTLLIDWPGRPATRHQHRSAHQDMPATLLQELFGCTNPASDYSSGISLFAGESWDWFIAGSYNSHAIVEPDKVVVTYPGGMIDLLNNDYRPSPDLRLDPNRVEEALLEMRRFYR